MSPFVRFVHLTIPFLALTLGCSAACKPRSPAAPAKAEKGAIEVTDFNTAALAPLQTKFDSLVARGDKSILFRLNSYGGSTDAGVDFIEHIRAAKVKHGLKVTCLVASRAESMGFYFLETACDERLMARSGLLMVHAALSAGAPARISINELKSILSETEAISDTLAGWAAPRLKLTKDAFRGLFTHGEFYMSADQALARKAVDRIVDPAQYPAAFPASAATWTSTDLGVMWLH